jgi:seryl-tRNA synthetase
MLSIDVIRNETDRVREACRLKHADADVGKAIELDDKRKTLIAESDKLKADRNKGSKEIGERKKKGENTAQLEARMKEISSRSKELDTGITAVEEELRNIMLRIPNLPDPSVPMSPSAEANVVVKEWGEKRKHSFKVVPHYEIGKKLGMLDLERAAKITGSFFPCYTGTGALLERALWNFMLNLHTREHGYTEVFPPFLVNRKAMTGTGQLPKLEEDMYRISEEDFFLIPTAEVPVTNLFMDEILNEADLPKKMTAYTACFRREAGTYGKDTRGIVRVHQFNKVEMVKFCTPETSNAEHETLLQDAEAVLQAFGLHYRVVLLAAGDMSFSAAKCYDIEVWAPGMDRYLEVSSCSNFGDFQARRMNCRYRTKDGKVRFVHTLNGSGTAMPRVWIAIVENFQQADGSIEIPEVLRPYMGGLEKIGPLARG